jgi:O-antigen ligase
VIRLPMLRLLDRLGLVAILLCPLFLLHSRALADITISLIALAFLARSIAAPDWSWLRTGWVRVAAAWWLWLLFCSLPGIGLGGISSLGQALASVRFLIFAAALEYWVLVPPERRRWLLWLIQASALYIALQSAVQLATGRNLFGDPRGPDGEITGPYVKPMAAAPYNRLLFPAVLPVAARLLARPNLWPKLLSGALMLAGVGIAVLMGERMPMLLTGLGLVVTGLLLPQLRRLVILAIVVAVVLIPASLIVSPPAYHRLVTKFSEQMEHFPSSQYGELAARAVTIAEQRPWTGRGFDGFRTGCTEPRYFHGWFGGDGGGAAICAQHPHNHYLQAVTDSGFPGLILFCAMILAWLLTVGRGLWRNPDPLRVGLFVAVLLQEWPIASTSDFVNMPLGGWFFLLLGFALAEARAAALR